MFHLDILKLQQVTDCYSLECRIGNIYVPTYYYVWVIVLEPGGGADILNSVYVVEYRYAKATAGY